MPRVSVVVPAYNAMPYLPETVASLLAQTYADFEAVVVDNGSTDGTGEWARSVRDDRLRVVRVDVNRGLSAGYNAGVRETSAPYSAFLEADDLWHPDKLRRQVEVLDDDPRAGLVYTWVELVDADGRRSGRVVGRRVQGDVRGELLTDVVVPCGSSPMVRRDLLLQAGGWDESLRSSPDWDLYLRLAPLAEWRVVPEPLVGYRQHDSNTSLDWRETDRDLRVILDRAYADAPPELLAQREATRARMTLYFAWKTLRTGDAAQAAQLRDRAAALDPSLRRTGEYARLTAHVRALGLLGRPRYLSGLRGLRAARGLARRLPALPSRGLSGASA